MGLTDDRNDPRLTHGVDDAPRPQAEMYLVLSEAERAKGFVRPVRRAYVHFGYERCGRTGCLHSSSQHVIDPDTDEGFADCRAVDCPCVAFTHSGRGSGCGAVTTMAEGLAETYAAQPSFYGATYCVSCGKHLRVDEFLWDGTTQLVGS